MLTFGSVMLMLYFMQVIFLPTLYLVTSLLQGYALWVPLVNLKPSFARQIVLDFNSKILQKHISLKVFLVASFLFILIISSNQHYLSE